MTSLPRHATIAVLLGVLATCREEPRPLGQLVISIQTDMSLPEQIDTIRVQVSVRGFRYLDQEYAVGTSEETRIPATLALVAGSDPSTPVTIRVMGRRKGVWRTFREAITTVPSDRTASLRMPIQWLCDGSARTMPSADDPTRAEVRSTCDDEHSCVAGRCVPSPIEMTALPTYRPEAVFGGSAVPKQGTCFDTVACMTRGSVVEPRTADCTIAKPAGVDQLNLALRVASGGICDASGGTCFVPLDAGSGEGWVVTPAGDRVALPPAVCGKLARGEVSGVYLSTVCASKTEALPVCGAWSSVEGGVATPPADAPPPPPVARALLSLHTAATDGVPCCPLMPGAPGQVLTCMCPSKETARVVALELASQTVRPVMEIALTPDRANLTFAAAVFDRTLYWVDAARNTIERATLADGKRAPAAQIAGEITEATPLLVDGDGLYLLASAVAGAQGSPVQLVKVDRTTGAQRSFDTGANFHVYEFAQDAAAIFMASDVDTAAGTAIQRRSRLVRIAKADGAITEVAPTLTLTTPDKLRGGYIGVHTDRAGGGRLYALAEDAAAGGSIVNRVVEVDPAARTATPLLERSLAAENTRLWLLGVVDRGVLLVRTDTTPGPAGQPPAVRASVIVLPAGGGPARIVADFARDYPLVGLPSLIHDADTVTWLNASGQLWQLPRSALAR